MSLNHLGLEGRSFIIFWPILIKFDTAELKHNLLIQKLARVIGKGITFILLCYQGNYLYKQNCIIKVIIANPIPP